AEDGIRDDLVTGVQTCAHPIWPPPRGARTTRVRIETRRNGRRRRAHARTRRTGQDSPAAASPESSAHGRPTPGTRTSPTPRRRDRKSTRLNSSHQIISYAVFCLKKKKTKNH